MRSERRENVAARAGRPPEAPSGFEWHEDRWGWTLRSRVLDRFLHGWTAGGRGLWDERRPCEAGWEQLAGTAGLDARRIVRPRQVHGAGVALVGADGVAGDVDAVATRDRDLVLTVRVADCVPILMADPLTGAVAAVHAGWRGTSAGIAIRAVEGMRAGFGADPGGMLAAIGPSIGPCCYQVGDEVRGAFQAGWDCAALSRWFSPPGRLDLWQANRDQLARAGVPEASVAVSALCTACHPGWFESYRRDGREAGRMIAFIRAGGRDA